MLKWFLGLFNQNTEQLEQKMIDEYIDELAEEEKKLEEATEPEPEVIKPEPEPKATARGTYRFEVKKEEVTLPLHRYTDDTYKSDSFELHVHFDFKVCLFGEMEFDISSSELLFGGINRDYGFVEYSEEDNLLVNFLEANERGDILMSKIRKKTEQEVMKHIDKMNADKFKEVIKQGNIEISFDLNIKKDILKNSCNKRVLLLHNNGRLK